MKPAYRRVIPCLDTRNGRLVKGVNFVNIKDVGDPAENGAAYCAAGVRRPALVTEAAKRFGPDRVTVAIETRANAKCPSGFEVMVKGGTEGTGQDAKESLSGKGIPVRL